MKITERRLRNIIKSVIRENFANAGLELAKTSHTNIKLMSHVLKVSLPKPEHTISNKRTYYRHQADKLYGLVDGINGATIVETGDDTFEFIITVPAVLGKPEEIAQQITDKIEMNIG